MPRYHFNPATGRTGSCKADAGKCPFLFQGSRHFENQAEARAAVETYFTEPYTSLSGCLAVQVSRIQRELVQRDMAGVDFVDQLPLIEERDAIAQKISELKPELDELVPRRNSLPTRLIHAPLNEDLGDTIIGFHNKLEELQAASLESFNTGFTLSEAWVSSLTTEEVQLMLAYSGTPESAEEQRDLFNKAIEKAPPLAPTTVYSGLSEYVGRDVLHQLASGHIELAYPISTSLNAAQTNGFMKEIDGEHIAVEIETTAGASMLALSHSSHEFEILLPSGTYEVLEIRKTVTMLWHKDGLGRVADTLVKLRRLP